MCAIMDIEDHICVASFSCLPMNEAKFVVEAGEFIKVLDDLRIAWGVVFGAKTEENTSRSRHMRGLFCHLGTVSSQKVKCDEARGIPRRPFWRIYNNVVGSRVT